MEEKNPSNMIDKQHLPALSWTTTAPFPTTVVMGCGRTVATEVAVASLTIPEFWTPPLVVLTFTVRLFTAVGLLEQPLFKLDWNVMEYLKAQVTNVSYYTLIFYKFPVRLKNKFFPLQILSLPVDISFLLSQKAPSFKNCNIFIYFYLTNYKYTA